MLNVDSLSVVLTYRHIFLWQEPIILYKENVIQENSKDAVAAAGSYVVREKCKDISASNCFGSGMVQRHCCQQLRCSGKVQRCCCWQLMWFRKSAKTFLLAVFLVQEKCKDIAAGS